MKSSFVPNYADREDVIGVVRAYHRGSAVSFRPRWISDPPQKGVHGTGEETRWRSQVLAHRIREKIVHG
ncbi:hypothetical protein KSF_107940 [Reticulibacter mediterranei]|uniref:Uncharacterized protein n=1 Tax=Reticulibacter mediterranei TaxID=2778369 RepID=A0A8J3J4V2_9CHLR|nr:hypothetical protein [Reticulibacter mediterranei]GHP00747.1 hypothetical protein KSF_107940 [Reticulibacter mediterranei]